MKNLPPIQPLRVANFRYVLEAKLVVSGLRDAGFRNEQVSVLCSDRTRRVFFASNDHDRFLGSKAARAAEAGAVLGGLAAGFAAVATVVATDSDGLLLAGSTFAVVGAAVGAFVGVMMSRGSARAISAYYERAVPEGEILVAAEIPADGDRRMLDSAERVFESAGALPVALPVG
jgi:hypothetical protein